MSCGSMAAGATWPWEADMRTVYGEIKKHFVIYMLFLKNSLRIILCAEPSLLHDHHSLCPEVLFPKHEILHPI